MCSRPRYGRRLVCNPCEKHKLQEHRGPNAKRGASRSRARGAKKATGKKPRARKSKAAAKVKRGNLMASKRGMAPQLDTAAIKKTIQAEAKKLAVKMVAAAQGGAKGGKGKGGVGGRKGKAVKISFKAADLKKTTDRNLQKQLQGILAKSPKKRGGGGGGGGGGGSRKQGGSNRKIVLR